MKDIETNIKYKTFKILQLDRGKKLTEIKVPDGVVFHLSMGRVLSAYEDRDTYNFIAVIPYDKSIYEFLIKQKCDCHVENLFNIYISWTIKDSIPENFNTFPFTTADLSIEPFYIKTVNVNYSKKEKMYTEITENLYNRDGKYPSLEEMIEIERKCIEESSTVIGYSKIINISFSGVYTIRIRCMPDRSDTMTESGIFRQYITYNSLFSDNNLLTTENEFNNAAHEVLQDLDILNIL